MKREQWKKIRTAPKDGTFLLTAEPSGYVTILQWCSDGYWRRNVNGMPGMWDPAHWQRLPKAPCLLSNHKN